MHSQSDCNWMQRSLWTKPKRRYVNKRQWENKQQLLKGTVKDESSLDQLRQRKGFRKQWKANPREPSLIANAVGEANTLVRCPHTCHKNVFPSSWKVVMRWMLDTVLNSRLADTGSPRLRWTQERRSQRYRWILTDT